MKTSVVASRARGIVPGLVLITVGFGLTSPVMSQTAPVTAVSKNAAEQTANARSTLVDMTPDGQAIVFVSQATDLADSLPAFPRENTEPAVFVHQPAGGHIEEVAPGANAVISNDARYVVFSSDAPDLVTGDTNAASDVFSFDRLSGTARLLSTNEFENSAAGDSTVLAVSGNGRHVVFSSSADNLDLSNVLTRGFDLYVLDRDADANGVLDEVGTLRPRRIIPAGALLPDSGSRSFSASLSFDGRYLTYSTGFRGVAIGALVGNDHLYLHDRDVDDDGLFDEPGLTSHYLLATDNPNRASISDDGRYVAFSYYGDNALAATVPSCDASPQCRLFVLDLDSNGDGVIDPATLNVRTALRPNLLPGSRNGHSFPTLSASGNYLSYRQELVGSTGIHPGPQVFLYDLTTGSEQLASNSLTGRMANRSSRRSIPADSGGFVAFESSASNLVRFDINRQQDVFVFDSSGTAPGPPINGQCEDRIDNDNDGTVDMDDPGCRSPDDQREDRVDAPFDPVVTSTVAVTNAPLRVGNATIVDAQGDTGRNPSFGIIFHGAKYIAYTSRAYNPTLGIFEDRLKLARNYGVYWEAETLSVSGVNPSLAIDGIQYVHTAFHDPVNRDLVYARNTTTIGDSLEVLESDGDTGRLPSLVVDSMDVPWIVYHDATRRELRLRSAYAATSELLVSAIDVCGLDAAITFDDRILIAYVDCHDRSLTVVRANFSGGLEANDVVDVGPVSADIAIASDAYGVGHVTYSADIGEPDPVRYAYATGAGWVTQRVPSQGLPQGLDIFMTLGIDANLIFKDDIGLRRIKFPQSFVFDQKPSVEIAVPAIVGDPADLTVALDPNGDLQLAYYDQQSRNLLQVDTVAAPWREHVVSSSANVDQRDLEFVSTYQDQTFSGQAPTAITFSSPVSGGVGELSVQRRFPLALDWQPTSITAAAPQDSADMSPDGQALAMFDNINSALNVYRANQAGVWSSLPPIAQLPQFEWLDHVSIFNNASPGAVAISAVHRGRKKVGEGLTVFRGNLAGGMFTEHPLPFSVPSISVAASAFDRGILYVAYVDQSEDELHLATFNQVWTDELVDDAAGFSLGRSVSLELTYEQLPAEPGQAPRSAVVPSIVYYNASNNQVRHASRVTGWEYVEYDNPIANLRQVKHVLDNDSRRRPIIAVAGSDGTLRVLRHQSDAAAQLEVVTTDYDGNGPISLGQSPSAVVAFTANDDTVRYAISGSASALPAARGRQEGGAASPTALWCLDSSDSSKWNPVNSTTRLDARHRAGEAATLIDDDAIARRWETQFARTAAGQSYIDFMRRDYPKITRIMAADHGLLVDGTSVLQDFLPGIRAMVDGNGSQATLDQQTIDAALDIWQRLADRDDGSLSTFIEAELLRWNNLQDFVGMTYDEWGVAIGLDVSAVGSGADFLFVDSFEG